VVDVVDVDVDAFVVVESDGPLGVGAPVSNRHPAPGGLKALRLTIGGGRSFDGPVGGVVDGVVVRDGEVPSLVVGPEGDVVVGGRVVVESAAVEWWPFNWKPMTTSAVTQSPSTTRRVQPGRAPSRVGSFGIEIECNSER
jgi:hypothetical protein